MGRDFINTLYLHIHITHHLVNSGVYSRNEKMIRLEVISRDSDFTYMAGK